MRFDLNSNDVRIIRRVRRPHPADTEISGVIGDTTVVSIYYIGATKYCIPSYAAS